MEDPGEDVSSTAASSRSVSGDGGSGASEESGWTSYIDYFMETQQRRRKGEVSRADDGPSSTGDAGRRRSSTPGCNSGAGVGASTCLPPVLAGPSAVSRRLRIREGWRRKKVLYDESLEDTATSPISSPKLIELRDSDATHHQTKMSSCDEISRSKRKNTGGDVNGANTGTDTAVVKEDSAYGNDEAEEESRPLLGHIPMSAFRV